MYGVFFDLNGVVVDVREIKTNPPSVYTAADVFTEGVYRRTVYKRRENYPGLQEFARFNDDELLVAFVQDGYEYVGPNESEVRWMNSK